MSFVWASLFFLHFALGKKGTFFFPPFLLFAALQLGVVVLLRCCVGLKGFGVFSQQVGSKINLSTAGSSVSQQSVCSKFDKLRRFLYCAQINSLHAAGSCKWDTNGAREKAGLLQLCFGKAELEPGWAPTEPGTAPASQAAKQRS